MGRVSIIFKIDVLNGIFMLCPPQLKKRKRVEGKMPTRVW